MSHLGGVALTSPSLHTEPISEYKLNYLPFQILDSNHIPSCTSAGSVLQLWKFHKNPISCLGGVVLTRYMPSFFSWKYKLNYLAFQILDSDHICSCTSAGSVLQLCKVSQNSNKSFRRSCAYKVHGRTDRAIPIYPPKLCIIIHNFQRRLFRNRPIRNKNYLWRPCLLTDQN